MTPHQQHLRWVGVGVAVADSAAMALIAVLRHHAPHELQVEEISSALARTAFTTLGLVWIQPLGCRTPRTLFAFLLAALLLLTCSVVVIAPWMKTTGEEQEDRRLELAVSGSFALAEIFLLCLLAPEYLEHANKKKKKKKNEGADLETQLLDEDEEAVPSTVDDDPYKGQGATFRRLVALSYPERYILVTATFALFVSSIAGLATPLLFGKFIHSINSASTLDDGEAMHMLNETVLQMILLFVVSCAFSMLRGSLFTLAGERLVARFRVRLFDHIIYQDVAFFDTNASGELQSRLSSDTGAIQNAVTVNFSMCLRMVVQAVCSFVIIFFISWKLTLVMLSVVPVVGVLARMYGSFVKQLSKDYQDSLAKASETVEESFSSIRTVRSFHKEAFQTGKYAGRVHQSYLYGKQRAWAYGTFLGVIGLLASLAMCLVLWMGGRMVIQGSQDDDDDTESFSASQLTTFIMYTINLAAALGGLSELYSTLLSAVGSSNRMFAILDMDAKIDSRGSLVSTPPLPLLLPSDGSRIEFDGVSFAYPTRPEMQVLTRVSFVLEPRSVNAFVGSSGGGKSTICALLQRFYDPSEGEVRIDGRALPQMSAGELRRRMAVVSQEPTLFACSIRDNIAFGWAGEEEEDAAPTEEAIIEAAKRAGAYEFIMSFKPLGFDTQVGERGVQLSGGQKQRIAIARSILRNPQILLLDEATSALDSESEHVVQQALDELMQHRTTIVVAHRLTTVRHASKIFVMSNGSIVETGTYDELVRNPGGLFSALVARQLTHGS